MSGTQGPLETRPATTVPSRAALSAVDASPFNSGELAYVTGFGLYVLVRESVKPIDGIDTLAVGPLSSQGRWLSLQAGGGGGGGGLDLLAHASLTADVTNAASTAFQSLLSTSFTTTVETGLAIRADVTGEMNLTGQGQSGNFTVQVDGQAIPVVGQSFGFQAGASETPTSASIDLVVTGITPGPHTVDLFWASGAGLGSPPILSVLPVTKPESEGAHLIVEGFVA